MNVELVQRQERKRRSREEERKTYRLAAVVISIGNTSARLAALVQELALGDHAPKGKGATGGLGGTAGVDGGVVVPAAALPAGAVVLGVGAQGEGLAVGGGHKGVGLADGEAVAVGSDAQDQLLGGDAGGDPLGDALLDAALVVAGVAGLLERGVGAAGRGPGAKHVVAHDDAVVEQVAHGLERPVGRLLARGVVVRVQADRGGQQQRLGLRLAELRQERDEVGRVVGADGVAPEALLVGVLPVKVEAVQVVLLHQVEARLDERRAVLGAAHVAAEVDAARPAAQRDLGLFAVRVRRIDKLGELLGRRLAQVQAAVGRRLGKRVLDVVVLVPRDLVHAERHALALGVVAGKVARRHLAGGPLSGRRRHVGGGGEGIDAGKVAGGEEEGQRRPGEVNE